MMAPDTAARPRHRVEAFDDDRTGDCGWRCFPCGVVELGFSSLTDACIAADEHEGAS